MVSERFDRPNMYLINKNVIKLKDTALAVTGKSVGKLGD